MGWESGGDLSPVATGATRGHFKHNLPLPHRDLLIITYLTCAAEISRPCLDWRPRSSEPVHLRPFTKQAIKKRNGRCFSLCCAVLTRSRGEISMCHNYRTVGDGEGKWRREVALRQPSVYIAELEINISLRWQISLIPHKLIGMVRNCGFAETCDEKKHGLRRQYYLLNRPELVSIPPVCSPTSELATFGSLSVQTQPLASTTASAAHRNSRSI